MFRRIIAMFLTLALVFTACACTKQPGKNPETKTDAGNVQTKIELPETDKKVAVLVAPESQYPEDYRAAKALAEKYPEKVIVKEYADSRILTSGDSEIITFSREIAADPSYGAIVYARATRYTSYAISQAKEAAKNSNPGIKFICVEPEESVFELGEKADLVITADWYAAAKDIVAQAKAHGAEHFLFFSFKRHVNDNPLYGGIMAHIKTACEEAGITFIYEPSLDSNGTEYEMNKAKVYLSEAVARHIKNGTVGEKNVALFSTDSAVQATLVEIANERGFIYVSPTFPTAFNGIGEKYSVALPDDMNAKAYIENIKKALNADENAKGKFSSYTYTLAATLLTSAVYCAFDLVVASEDMNYSELAETVIGRLKAIAGNEAFTASHYDTENHVNLFKAYCPGYEIIK